MKKLTYLLMPLAVALSLAACSDYDNGYTQEQLQYAKDFKEVFGEIDSEQDWNAAERTSVTVTTSQTSEIKIYALVDGTYSIVGDYSNVNGTQELGFDVRKGVTELIVSDGKEAVKTTVGGSANFSGTRTTYAGNGVVKVSKIESPEGYEINGITYPMYLYATTAETEAVKAIVPEIGHRDTYTNLNNVTHDFNYVSTGEFVIYPYYYQTSAVNTLGIYYYDANGQRQEVDIYKIKEGDELQYENNTYTVSDRIYTENMSDYGTSTWAKKLPAGEWTIDNGEGLDHFHVNGWSTEGNSDGSQMTTPFIEYWRGTGNNLLDGTISRTFTGLEPGTYGVWIDARAYNEGSTTSPSGITFFANEGSLDLCANGNKATYNSTSELVYYKDCLVRCTVSTDGQLTVGFNLSDVTGDWLSFKNLRIDKLGDWNDAITTGKSNVRRGQGIIVDIPVGTPFGMYLTTANSTSSTTFYSQSELNNDPSVCGYGVRDDGNGNVTLDTSLRPSYASTFYVGEQMFLGFEDWTNAPDNGTAGDGNPGSDFDLNDLVLAFSGSTPTIINEDPKAATWILACEDLGGSFDTDYNDVVLKVEHVSGQTTAKVTPLAAGGTLASYIFYNDPLANSYSEQCVGEIHQLFGREPITSGSYSPINVGSSRGTAGTPRTIEVDANWSMAYYSAADWNTAQQYSTYNMGGFEIRVLPEGTEPLTGTFDSSHEAFGAGSRIAAPDKGEAPMMLCLPYTYKKTGTDGKVREYVWAWSRELCSLSSGQGYGDGSYPQFAAWVKDRTVNADWYMYPAGNTVDELILSESEVSTDSGNDAGDTDDNNDNNYGTQVLTSISASSTVPASAFADATTKVYVTVLYKAGQDAYAAIYCTDSYYVLELKRWQYDTDTYVTYEINNDAGYITQLKQYGITKTTDWNQQTLQAGFGGMWIRCE